MKNLEGNQVHSQKNNQMVQTEYKKMNTRHLLDKYRFTKLNLSFSDMYEEEYIEEIEKEIAAMKKELNTREHIPNKAEAKKIRQEKAKRK